MISTYYTLLRWCWIVLVLWEEFDTFMCEITQRWSIKPSSALAHVGIPHQPTCFLSQPGWLSDRSLSGAVLLLFPRDVLQYFLIPLSSVVVTPSVLVLRVWVCGMVLLMNQLPKCCGSCWLPPQGTTPCGGWLNPAVCLTPDTAWFCPFGWQRQRNHHQKRKRLYMWF